MYSVVNLIQAVLCISIVEGIKCLFMEQAAAAQNHSYGINSKSHQDGSGSGGDTSLSTMNGLTVRPWYGS
jgi:hypothetical protein